MEWPQLAFTRWWAQMCATWTVSKINIQPQWSWKGSQAGSIPHAPAPSNSLSKYSPKQGTFILVWKRLKKRFSTNKFSRKWTVKNNQAELTLSVCALRWDKAGWNILAFTLSNETQLHAEPSRVPHQEEGRPASPRWTSTRMFRFSSSDPNSPKLETIRVLINRGVGSQIIN